MANGIYQLLPTTNTPLAPQNPQSGSILGTDISSAPDLYFVQVTGFINIANAILRRWQTQRGGLFYDPDYGTDLRDFVNSASSAANLYQIGTAAEAEAEKDPRVVACITSVSFDPVMQGFTINAQITTSAGPFVLVTSVSNLGVSMLSVQST